jgi:hypothetical protein
MCHSELAPSGFAAIWQPVLGRASILPADEDWW